MRTNWMIAGLILSGAPLAAQVVLTGTVVDDSTQAPIPGVEVAMEGPGGARAVTSADGGFTLVGLPAGIGGAVIRKIGYRPVRLRIFALADDTLDVRIRLKQAAVELEPLEVRATSLPPGMQSYADRRFSGLGSYLDPEMLRRSEHRRLSDLLRGLRGVRLRPVGGTRYVAVSSRGNCPMAVWMDGVPIYRPGSRGSVPDIDAVPVSNLEAVEVYRGAGDTPAELGGTGAGCGTIVLWTRRR